MRKRSAALAAIFALTMGAAACGDDGGGDGYTIADVCDTETGLYIDFFNTAFECSPEIEAFLGGFPSAAEIAVACEANFQPYLDDGTVVLSQNDADWTACLAFIAGIDCETFSFDGPNPCEAVFGGQLLDGEDCDDDLQCPIDSYCDNSDGLACGACTPQLAVDDTCDSNEQCLSGLCAATDNTCQEYGQLGDTCADNDECAGRLECDALGECVPETIWALNDACDGGDIPSQCGFPLSDWYCHPNNNVCTAYLELGEVCGQGAGFCRIFDYESCENGGANVDDTCVAPIIVNEGDACDFNTGEKCADGLFCSNDTCVAPAIEGDSCVDDCVGGILLSCSDDGECVYNDYTGLCPGPPE